MPLQPSPFVVRVFPRAVLVVVVIVSLVPVLLMVTVSEDEANKVAGDFPSFYAAGEIVLDGQMDRLYDPALQREYQRPYHEEPGEFLFFAYPPVTALVYASIAWLPYPVALALHSVLAMLALVAAMWLVIPLVVPRHPLFGNVTLSAAAAVLTFPIITSVMGGQNTTFTLLLVAATWRFSRSGNSIAVGLAASALLYKPQFGILILVMIAIAQMWKALASAMVGASLLYASGAAMIGPRWPLEWADQVRVFADQNADVNGALMINVTGWADQVAGDVAAAAIGAVVVIVAISIPTSYIVFRHGLKMAVFGVVTAWMLLASPSTLFYDSGVAIVGFGIFVALMRGPWYLIAVAILASWIQVGARSLGWSPLFLIVSAMWAWQTFVLLRSGAPLGLDQRSGGSDLVSGEPSEPFRTHR